MPIYEYRCQSCGHEHEALQKISDPLLTDCPDCGESALKKKVSAAGFRLKGGGWYETDFKSGNKKNVVGDKSADSAKSESGESKKDGAKDSGGGTDGAKTDKATKTTDSSSSSASKTSTSSSTDK